MANETVTYDIKQIRETQTTILLNQTEFRGEIKALETKLEGKINTLQSELNSVKKDI